MLDQRPSRLGGSSLVQGSSRRAAPVRPPGGGDDGLGDFTLFAGPCVLEADDLNLEVATGVKQAAEEVGLAAVFKASFDKANRSRLGAHRGPGLSYGLRQLQRVAEDTGLRLMTDIHEPSQAAPVAEVVDVIQIPAFLCRQTSLLAAAGRTGMPVNIKKGQWMSSSAMAGTVEKVARSGPGRVLVTERGSAFGSDDLVVDMRNFSRLRSATGAQVVFDGTHSVQRPGAMADGSTGGARDQIAPLVRGAVAAGCDGLFLEVHPNPRRAPSDSECMLPLAELPRLLAQVVAIRRALGEEARSWEDNGDD